MTSYPPKNQSFTRFGLPYWPDSASSTLQVVRGGAVYGLPRHILLEGR